MTEARRGLFLNFEGLDGCGKTTQARLLAERLRQEGYEVLESVEPGGTPIGREIRRILLDPANQELRATTELLLYFACRAQNVEQWITPALAAMVTPRRSARGSKGRMMRSHHDTCWSIRENTRRLKSEATGAASHISRASQTARCA